MPKDASRSIDTEDPPTTDPSKPAEEPEYPWLKAPVASADTIGYVKVPDGSGLHVDEEGYLSLKKDGDNP